VYPVTKKWYQTAPATAYRLYKKHRVFLMLFSAYPKWRNPFNCPPRYINCFTIDNAIMGSSLSRGATATASLRPCSLKYFKGAFLYLFV
jgi:hypothetical protein